MWTETVYYHTQNSSQGGGEGQIFLLIREWRIVFKIEFNSAERGRYSY